MSRIRKYRIYSGGAMHYGGFSIHATGKVLPDFSFIKESDPVMDYTGKKDKNGKDIYEGDALNHPYFDEPIIVQWNDDDACFESSGVVSEWISCEVVGNIYQNPELIEK